MVVQSARAVKTGKRNARELGERGRSPMFFPSSPPSQIARVLFSLGLLYYYLRAWQRLYTQTCSLEARETCFTSLNSHNKKKIRHISAILFQLTNNCVYHLTPQKVYGCKIRLNRVNSPHPPPPPPITHLPFPHVFELYRVYCTKLIVSHQLDTSIKRKRQFLVCPRQTRVFKF